MTTYRPYSVYKPFDVDWLGDLPNHWELRRLKFVAPPATTKLNEKPTDKLYLGLENIESGTGRLLLDSPIENVESVVTVFQPDDVLFGKLRPYLAKVVHADFEGVCTGELMVLRPVNHLVHSRFLFYLMLSHGFINIVDSMTYGAKMPRANPNHVVNLPISLPSLAEQRAIAAFLDRETVWLDTLIAKKRELIDLLHKQRTAIISHAVTKGLNPHAPLKPSGIEWLGDVPAYWEVRRLKFLLKERLRYGANEVAELDNPNYPRYIRITDINPDGSLRSDTFRSLPPEVAKPYMLKDGDILFARSGATVGKTFQYSSAWGDACFAGYLILCRPDNRLIDSRFLYLFTQSHSYLSWRDSIFIQATIQNISAEKYYNVIIAVPPLSEQQQIVDFLSQETAYIDEMIAKIETSIDLLQKQRTAIISAAVTGKIDVRTQEPA
ncbi:MAG: restriction endonuclease subunit S [Chloroflexi bacterium]|nr:restriction endonuclease subunit S [Chloroflexota bacterium]MBP8056481.1 restriction endonuclease subunit S [Chloroflexota bacterium]